MDPEEIEELVRGYTPAQKKAILEKVPLWTLHRYFMWSNLLRVKFDLVAQEMPPLPEVDRESEVIARFAGEFGMFMSYFYGSLYVVVEGWREMKLSDPTVEALLKSPNVDLLRKYRNGVFHYQKTYLDKKFHRLWGEGVDVVNWVRELDDAFSEFFVRQFPLPDEEQ
ncbi:MAG: hypothetical protein O7H41_15800 [Planctomycetota bacterium]|nr:hypothetical protein [Planctomycetota bacterium]